MARTDGFEVDAAAHLAAVSRLASTSKRAAVDVLKAEARFLFVEVAKVTPPAGGKKGNTLKGKDAENAGKLAIVRDMHVIYGMPGRAFSDLQDVSQRAAGAFWGAYKRGDERVAGKIIKSTLGKSFVPFDGGKAARGMLGKRRSNKALFYITNPAELRAHIAELQSRVWYLANGWREALQALKARLPYGIGKQNAPGRLSVEVSAARIEIKMSNDVRYARQLPKLRQQIAFAMRVRTGVLQRRWDDWMKTLARENGMKKR
jgi:hypothetical protein